MYTIATIQKFLNFLYAILEMGLPKYEIFSSLSSFLFQHWYCNNSNFSLLFQLVDQLGSQARAQKLGNNNFGNGIVLPKFIFLSPTFGQIISLSSLLLFVTILVTPLPKFTSLLTNKLVFKQYLAKRLQWS